MEDDAERQRTSRHRRQDRGERRICVWLSPQAQEDLETLARKWRWTKRTVVEELLRKAAEEED